MSFGKEKWTWFISIFVQIDEYVLGLDDIIYVTLMTVELLCSSKNFR